MNLTRMMPRADAFDWIAAGTALGRLVRRIAGRVAASARRRSTCRELLRLDDRMLADIGLTRYDVEAYAAGQLGTTEILVAEDGPSGHSATLFDFPPRNARERLGVALARCVADRAAEAA